MNDTLWITLPVTTWGKLFERATQADRDASDFLRILIERGEFTTTNNPAPQLDENTTKGVNA
jgi:hypothetical protein